MEIIISNSSDKPIYEQISSQIKDAILSGDLSTGEALPSTPMELVRRLTEQEVTPGTLDTAFSTRALQAAQLMPVTLYCSI